MTHAELKARMDDDLPFVLHVADGRTYEVPRRDFIWMPPRSTVVMVATPSEENPDETVSHYIPLLMVSGVSQKFPAA